MRLLALEFGADIVYCEEIIDHKMLKCRRFINDVLGTVDFIDDTEDTVVFRTCARETGRVVFQIGTCDAQRALKVAKLVENDVAAIDVNMGCPKEFSLKGGMGAALLNQPEKIKEILTVLVEGISKPVTCKIRVLPMLEDTIALCKLIEETGVSALAIHGRTKDERPRHPNRNEIIRAVRRAISIPVIANGGSGEINCFEDIHTFLKTTEASSVMIARAAQWNCSIFSKNEKVTMGDIIMRYLKYAIDYDNHPLNTKYCVQQMLQDQQETPKGRIVLAAKTLLDISAQWNLEAYYKQAQNRFRNAQRTCSQEEQGSKRIKANGVTEMAIKYLRSSFKDCELPKTKLYGLARKEKWPNPIYETESKDKLFKSVVTVSGKKFTPNTWEKNKKSAEQAAALVCLHDLGLMKFEHVSVPTICQLNDSAAPVINESRKVSCKLKDFGDTHCTQLKGNNVKDRHETVTELSCSDDLQIERHQRRTPVMLLSHAFD